MILSFRDRFFSGVETGGASGQEPPASQNNTAGSQTPPATTGAAAPGGSPADDVASLPEWAQRIIRETRSEAANLRVSNKDLSEFKTKAETEKLSEKERLEKAASDAKTEADRFAAELRTARAETKIIAEAAKAGLPADLAVKLITPQFDEQGQPKGIAEAVADLVKQYPNLVATGGSGPSTSAGNPGRNRDGVLTLAALKTMTPQQVAALPKEQVAAALAAGK